LRIRQPVYHHVCLWRSYRGKSIMSKIYKIAENILVSGKELYILEELFFTGSASSITDENELAVYSLSNKKLVDLRDFYGGGFGLTQEGLEIIRAYCLKKYKDSNQIHDEDDDGFVLCATDSMGKFFYWVKGKEECDCCVGYRMMIMGIIATAIPFFAYLLLK